MMTDLIVCARRGVDLSLGWQSRAGGEVLAVGKMPRSGAGGGVEGAASVCIRMHPYEVTEILALPVAAGLAGLLEGGEGARRTLSGGDCAIRRELAGCV
jgi:hypothetical protein